MWWLSRTAPVFLQFPESLKYLAFPVLVVGLSFDILGIIAFFKRKTTINPLTPHKSTVLVTEGVFRVTRNPMYLGLALVLTAWGLWLHSLLPVLLGPTLFVLYITRFQIKPEEEMMLKLFGESYRNYVRAVRRWI